MRKKPNSNFLKNSLIFFLLSVTIFYLFVAFAAAFKDPGEAKSQDFSQISLDLNSLETSSIWNITSKANIVGLEDGALDGEFDGHYIKKITFNKGAVSFDMFLDSIGPAEFNVKSCYKGNIVDGDNYFAVITEGLDSSVHSLDDGHNHSSDEFLSNINFFNKDAFATREDEEFDGFYEDFLELINRERGDEFSYCQKDFVNIVQVDGIVNQKTNKEFDKLFVGEISTVSDKENVEDILKELEKIKGFGKVQV